jgi:hypothetical protein
MTHRLVFAFVITAALLCAARGDANTLFTDLASPTGAAEWDVFDAVGAIGLAGPHPADVRSQGTGTASLSVSNVALGAGIPGPQVTSGFDLYGGSSIATHTIALNGAANASPQTTLVLQMAVSAGGTPLTASSVLLGTNTAPTEFVDRGSDG